ncbi:MAG: hypothetical protein ACSHX7_02790 [Luteolibacter sp.]
MGIQNQSLTTLRPLSDSELLEWEDAYQAVEAYLSSLRFRNRLLRAELVRKILWQASARLAAEPHKSARTLAIEETLREISNWTHEVLGEPLMEGRLAARGRLALLLAGMPDKWQGVFLTPAPWPGNFVEGMKKSYLQAGPQFAELTMVPHRLELNVIGSGAAQWWETMERRPILRKMFAAGMFGLLAAMIWFIFLS